MHVIRAILTKSLTVGCKEVIFFSHQTCDNYYEDKAHTIQNEIVKLFYLNRTTTIVAGTTTIGALMLCYTWYQGT